MVYSTGQSFLSVHPDVHIWMQNKAQSKRGPRRTHGTLKEHYRLQHSSEPEASVVSRAPHVSRLMRCARQGQ